MHYSPEELAFIEARHQQPREVIASAFAREFQRPEVTTAHITGLCKRMKWSRTQRFTPEDDAIIRDEYPDTLTAVLAARLQRPIMSVSKRANLLGVKKSAAFQASAESGRMQPGDDRGARSRYQKGAIPLNKGKKRPPGWAPGRMRETQFAKGMGTWNTAPVGAERVKLGYAWTKVSDTPSVPWTVNWRQTHIVRWEAVHGPIPDGSCLKCVDGNRLNCDPANWTLIERGLLPMINGGKGSRIAYDDAPAELKPTVLAVAKLRRAVSKRRVVHHG